jgi:hypothetical protein
MKSWQTIIIVVFALSLLLVACLPPQPSDPCATAKIVSPPGAKNKTDASHPNYNVSSEIEIKWEPSECVMVVQSYQRENPKPVYEYKGVVSGEKKLIGKAGSGATEIKIWRDGFNKQADNIWVWIK